MGFIRGDDAMDDVIDESCKGKWIGECGGYSVGTACALGKYGRQIVDKVGKGQGASKLLFTSAVYTEMRYNYDDLISARTSRAPMISDVPSFTSIRTSLLLPQLAFVAFAFVAPAAR